MFKLFVFAAVLAVAAAGNLPLPIASPLAYSAYGAYGTHAYGIPAGIAAAPLAYSAYAAPAAVHVPAPVTYTTGYKVINSVEPVEQHGYKIAY